MKKINNLNPPNISAVLYLLFASFLLTAIISATSARAEQSMLISSIESQSDLDSSTEIDIIDFAIFANTWYIY